MVDSQEVIADAVSNINKQIENKAEVKETIDNNLLTYDEQWAIILGEGIEYVTLSGYKLYIKPLTIRQKKLFLEFSKINDEKMSSNKQTDYVIDILHKILSVDKDELECNVDEEDLLNIHSILIYAHVKGRKVFEKKSLTVQELKDFTKDLLTIAK